MDVLQAPITAAEVEQARRQRDVVLPKLEQLYQQPWAKEYLGALDRSLERIRPLTVAIEQAQGKLEIARARFALGQATNFDITDAQEELLDAETELLEAIVEYNTALAQLEASIAGPV
jgi:outer membrane protein TolC